MMAAASFRMRALLSLLLVTASTAFLVGRLTTARAFVPTRTTTNARRMLMELTWTSNEGVLKASGERFHLKGINWYGFEDKRRCLDGITMESGKQSIYAILAFLQQRGFNAVRIPFSTAMALDLDSKIRQTLYDQDLRDSVFTVRDLLSKVIDLCGDHGLLVMLDNHRLGEDDQSPLWYGKQVKSATGEEMSDSHYYENWEFDKAWDNILGAYKNKGNLFAVDLKNEPYSHQPSKNIATWGEGNPSYDWNKKAEDIANQLAHSHHEFKGLFFVEGIQRNYGAPPSGSGDTAWWGGSLTGAWDHPIQLKEGNTNRVVYSPHVYGPGHPPTKPYFQGEPDFVHQIPEIWRREWAFVKSRHGNAVVLGEWGGTCLGWDEAWHWALKGFLQDNDMRDQFYWCLNPQSSNTGGGLLQFWNPLEPVEKKLQILDYLVPKPSRVVKDTNSNTFSIKNDY